MEVWYQMMKKADFNLISQKYGISPVLARLIRNRDVTEDKDIDFYLNGTIGDLYDGMLMKDMDIAIEILEEKIKDQEKIRVIGDYDIDGVSATYILQSGIGSLGGKIDTDIPDRVKDGYGLNRHLIDRALEDGIDTIITCDNGIAAAEEIAYGKENGLTIIVTDHHQVPYKEREDGTRKYILPPADAVVDPQRKDCEYPFKGLCGAAVAYKLVEALYEVMQRDVDEVDYLIENVAIATIGDVMDLQGENRVFVKQGLEMLRRTKNYGLNALIDCNEIDRNSLSAYHIGFVIGPCINASGRLDTAKKALELLNAEDEVQAKILASELKRLNDERKELTEEGVLKAIDQIETTSLKDDRVLVVYLPGCHESIVGIIAGRIREKYYRPVFVLTDGEGCVKGSGRSIDSYNMFEEMNKCAEIFIKFGGHKLAAGLSIAKNDVELFRHRINELCTLTEKDLYEKVSIDMRLPFPYISEQLVSELTKLEPCGKGNVRPLFAEKDVTVISPRIVGKQREVLVFTAMDSSGYPMDAIYFGDARECMEYMSRHKKMAFTFYPNVNEYRGFRKMQIVVVNYK